MHFIQYCCVSIGLVVAKQPRVGVVYNPFTDELYVASPGKPSTCNGKTIHVSGNTAMNKALLATGFPKVRYGTV